MLFDYEVLDQTERIIFAFRELCLEHGYHRYRMSKFEEYELYMKNKEFLISDSVITFTDTDGKLMALKPDVTLSIIKNDDDNDTNLRKLCYNESVYRVSKGTNAFKEIMQTGVECIGDVDELYTAEVLMLAAKSLKLLSDEFILELSGLGVVSAFVDRITDDYALRERLLKCAGDKNLHEITEILKENGIEEEKGEPLKKLLSLAGTPEEVIPELLRLTLGMNINKETGLLKAAARRFENSGMEDHLFIDFTVANDMNYYNGIVFKGYINGIPESVLSGGRYDRLMEKMGRKSRAVGFAIYLDLLERLKL